MRFFNYLSLSTSLLFTFLPILHSPFFPLSIATLFNVLISLLLVHYRRLTVPCIVRIIVRDAVVLGLLNVNKYIL